MNKLSKFYNSKKIYIENTSWVLAGNILQMGIGFFVTILISKHLGPEMFGALSYSLAIVGIFTSLGHLGLAGIVVKEIVNKPKKVNEIINTVVLMKLIVLSFSFVVLIMYGITFEGFLSIEFNLLFIIGLTMLFIPLKSTSFWFESIVQSKFVVASDFFSFIITTILKISFVFIGFGVIYFALANLIQVIISSFLILYLYIKRTDFKVRLTKVNKDSAYNMMSQGWLVFLGTMLSVVYLKIDQVMLRWMGGNESVGTYAVAAQLSEVWYFVPIAIVGSFFPKLLDLRRSSNKNYELNLQQLFDFMFILGFVVAVFMTFLSGPLITNFYGIQYIESVGILKVHVWAGVFIFMRAVFSRWIIIENALVFSLITQGAGALVNILLNFYLIPLYGGLGAAYATLISYAIASFFVLFFYKKTRPIFFMMLKSQFIFFRLLKYK